MRTVVDRTNAASQLCVYNNKCVTAFFDCTRNQRDAFHNNKCVTVFFDCTRNQRVAFHNNNNVQREEKRIVVIYYPPGGVTC